MENRYNSQTANLREMVLSNGNSNKIHEIFLDHIIETPLNGRILDIGTGNGYILREIKKKFPGRYILFGVDSSPEMLKKARQADSGSIDYSVGDNYNLPFNRGYFSTVTAKNVTRFSPEELSRVLEEEGLFVFREYGSGKGLAEVADCFPEKLIRSREPKFYVEQLDSVGFRDIWVQKFNFQREYTIDELLQIVQMFPFIYDLNNSDLKIIKELFGNKRSISVTADPFILTARRKKDA